MKIHKISECGCNNCSCHKKTEKGNYTPGPAKGHLDTQLFPESHGTKYDRNVVRKTVDRRKKSKTAAREKTMVGVDVFRGQGGAINQEQWDKAYTDARVIYKEMKDEQSGDPNSIFWDSARLSAEMKSRLIAGGIDEATADLAVESAIASDLRFRKSKRTANSKRYVIKVSQEQTEDGKLNDAIRNIDRIFGSDSASSTEPSAAPSVTPSENTNEVTVIYPDFDELGRKDTKEFQIPVPPEVSAKGTDEILNYVWRETNHVDGSEWIHDKPFRSSMVGDVYVINGENWVVMGVGFAKLPVPLDKWINTPDKWKFHSEEDFAKLIAEAFSHKQIKIAACKECNLSKESALADVDENTKMVGKIQSVAQAKKLCIEKNQRLPRIGYEMVIDEGEIEQTDVGRGSEFPQPNYWSGKHKYKYRTYLQNNAGAFRVWTWVDVNHA